MMNLLKFLKIGAESRVFKTYNQALSSIDKSDYSQKYFAEMIVQKNLTHRQLISENLSINFGDFRILTAIGIAKNNEILRVLDFGGGGGAQFSVAKKIFPDLRFKWVVVETPAIVGESSPLRCPELKFCSNISEAKQYLGGIDLVFASSSLEYCDDPYAILDELLLLKARYFFVTRTPVLSDSGDKVIYSIQKSNFSANGPGSLPNGLKDSQIYYPIGFMQKAKILNLISSKYTIKMVVDEGEFGAFSFQGERPKRIGIFASLT